MSIPIDIRIFANKFIKLQGLDEFDSFEDCVNKIKENQFILEEIYDLKNVEKIGIELTHLHFPKRVKDFYDRVIE